MSEDQQKPPVIIAARERGPGPGRYALPSSVGYVGHDYSKHMKPAYSLSERIEDACENYKKHTSPGPIYFVDPAITAKGKDGTPCFSILGRQRAYKGFSNPSPGKYSPEKVHPQGERNPPKYSMSNRGRHRKRDSVPAPNRYHLPPILGAHKPNVLSAPSHSMTGRTDVGSYSEDLYKTPGPGQYHSTEPNTIRRKQACYSLQGRSHIPVDSTKKPGPGQHSPEKVYITRPNAPKFSLGIRHSEFVCPVHIF